MGKIEVFRNGDEALVGSVSLVNAYLSVYAVSGELIMVEALDRNINWVQLPDEKQSYIFQVNDRKGSVSIRR